MPRDSLTPKQEAFAHKFVETGNAAEAYRFAYDASKMAVTTIYPHASRLLDNGKVAARVAELKARSLAHVDVGATDIARVAWQIASDSDVQPSARVSALSLLAKRHPEFSDKHDMRVDQRTQALMAVSEMPLEQLIAIAEGLKDDE